MNEETTVTVINEIDLEEFDYCTFFVYGVRKGDQARVRVAAAETHGDALFECDRVRKKRGKEFHQFVIEEWLW